MKAKLLIFLLLITVTGCTPKNKCDMEITTPKTKLEVGSGITRGGKTPQSRLYINPNAGSVCIGKTERTITISIDRYNELTKGAIWLLKDVYSKNDCLTCLWENKETKEVKESIGTHPPSKLIILNK